MWFLLAWTAPNRARAITSFQRFQKLDPQNPLAADGLSWSQSEWSRVQKQTERQDISKLTFRRETALAAENSVTIPRKSYSPQPAYTTLRSALAGWTFYGMLGLYLLGIAVAEWITTFHNPQLGLIVHGILLVLIFLHAALKAKPNEQKFMFTLALAPLIRLLSLAMPLVQFPYASWYAIIGIPLLLAALLTLRLTGYRWREVGLGGGNILQALLIGCLGLGLGWAEYQILKPDPLVEHWTLQEALLPALALLVFTGFLEEFIFRGLMQRAAQPMMNLFGLIYISLLFAVLHIGYQSLADFLFVFEVGFIFALIVRWSGNIWGVALAHALTNISLFMIFPLL